MVQRQKEGSIMSMSEELVLALFGSGELGSISCQADKTDLAMNLSHAAKLRFQ